MKNAMKTLVAMLALTAVSACGGSAAHEETTAHHEGMEHHAAAPAGDAALVPNGEAHIGDRTRCPVNGEEFTVTESSPHVEYQGKTYYLCCDHCIGAFEANPAQYVGGGEAATTAE